MSTAATAARAIKGLTASFAVGFGVVGTILLVEVIETIPDNLSYLVLVVGFATAVWSGWRASRPKTGIPQQENEVSVE